MSNRLNLFAQVNNVRLRAGIVDEAGQNIGAIAFYPDASETEINNLMNANNYNQQTASLGPTTYISQIAPKYQLDIDIAPFALNQPFHFVDASGTYRMLGVYRNGDFDSVGPTFCFKSLSGTVPSGEDYYDVALYWSSDPNAATGDAVNMRVEGVVVMNPMMDCVFGVPVNTFSVDVQPLVGNPPLLQGPNGDGQTDPKSTKTTDKTTPKDKAFSTSLIYLLIIVLIVALVIGGFAIKIVMASD